VRISEGVIWYGRAPLPGVRDRLVLRGARIVEVQAPRAFVDKELSDAGFVVLNYANDETIAHLPDAKLIRRFIDHGLHLAIVCPNALKATVIATVLTPVDSTFSWNDERYVRFIPDFGGVNFDFFIAHRRETPWHNSTITKTSDFESLTESEEILLRRAFQEALEIRLTEVQRGFSGSRVFMAYEKEQRNSVGHWTQPRLVKIGARGSVVREVAAMEKVSPFVPFELRPNLLVAIEGTSRALYTADFVDMSETLLKAAREGRAEAALSNFFNRIMRVWRDCAWEYPLSTKSLAQEAEDLKMFSVDQIKPEYLESQSFVECGYDVNRLWNRLKTIRLPHRVATIHADLHGDNVRIRGDDAILIDLGSLRGTDAVGEGAPICFDVAMLEVALAFQCHGGDGNTGFNQREWSKEISDYYELDRIQSASRRDSDRLSSWMHGPLQRIRAFGIYEQSFPYEYAVALAIGMWRWCKFPVSQLGDVDHGRRVVALKTGARLIEQIMKRHSEHHPESLP